MPRPAVQLDGSLRAAALDALVGRLIEDGIEVIIASAGGKHFHILARFADHRPRHWIGLAKKHASHLVRQQGMRAQAGGLWAKRCGVRPIIERDHQVNVFHYIDGHRAEGAIVWRFDGK
jgi:hypothetical protein